MSNREVTVKEIDTEHARTIGKISGSGRGPYIVAIAGMHGNEPSGVKALEEVFELLKEMPENLSGSLLAIKGNLPALEQNTRQIDEDMNRLWFPSIIDKIRRTPFGRLESSERREIKKLLPVIDGVKEQHSGPIIFVDLHSFSAEGAMFAITANKKEHRELLSGIPIPLIFGIEESLRGTALRYFQDQEFITLAIEGGQHRNRMTVYNQVAGLLALLDKAGFMDGGLLPGFDNYANHLARHTSNLPRSVELVYQHIIEPGDDFSMRPGYRNFQPVKRGEWLANDKTGRICAHSDGYVLMPRYQKEGDDGFFIVQKTA